MLRTIYGTVQQKVSGAPQETARFMVSRTILKRVGGSHRRNGRSKKKCLMGNSITQDQLEKQEQEERTSPWGMRYRSWEYEDGGHELGTEKNGGASCGRPGPKRGWAIAAHIYQCQRKQLASPACQASLSATDRSVTWSSTVYSLGSWPPYKWWAGTGHTQCCAMSTALFSSHLKLTANQLNVFSVNNNSTETNTRTYIRMSRGNSGTLRRISTLNYTHRGTVGGTKRLQRLKIWRPCWWRRLFVKTKPNGTN